MRKPVYRDFMGEEQRPQKLHVIFSTKITQSLEDICASNQDNTNALSQWFDYLEAFKQYISNPVIAWDYTNRHHRFPNGTIYMNDLNYNAGYSIITNNANGLPCVYVFKLNLNIEAFDLKKPSPTANTVFKESQLRSIVRDAVRCVLCEKLYNPSVEPMIDRRIGDYDVLDGSWTEQILGDIPQKGWIQDICMYSAVDAGGKTYALYRRCDNGKYFFMEKVSRPNDEYIHTILVSHKAVPNTILSDAKALIRNGTSEPYKQPFR